MTRSLAADDAAELIRRAYEVGPPRPRPLPHAPAGWKVKEQAAGGTVVGRLLGKSAVVTGAARGIGRATAELFASEGARLVLSDRDGPGLAQLREALALTPGGVESVVGDVAEPADARRMIETAVRQRNQAAYGPAKFVASGLTKHLAIEWAGHGIRVNAVAPGTIKTDRVRLLGEEPGGASYLDAIRRMHPMGRLGEPAEVARAILFLASDEASFITGAVLPVDGGYLAQ